MNGGKTVLCAIANSRRIKKKKNAIEWKKIHIQICILLTSVISFPFWNGIKLWNGINYVAINLRMSFKSYNDLKIAFSVFKFIRIDRLKIQVSSTFHWFSAFFLLLLPKTTNNVSCMSDRQFFLWTFNDFCHLSYTLFRAYTFTNLISLKYPKLAMIVACFRFWKCIRDVCHIRYANKWREGILICITFLGIRVKCGPISSLCNGIFVPCVQHWIVRNQSTENEVR